jgi:hypothetical protein
MVLSSRVKYSELPPPPQKSVGARPYGFKNLCPSKKPPTVTQQLTKPIDFRQNYVCDGHPCLVCWSRAVLLARISRLLWRSSSSGSGRVRR